MYKIELKFNSNCNIIEKIDTLKFLEELFINEDINSSQITNDTYEYVSNRTDNKLLGSFWAVLFKLKRSKHDVQKLFERFEWIHNSNDKVEIRENLIENFFRK